MKKIAGIAFAAGVAAFGVTASARTTIVSSEVKLNERLARADATVRVTGYEPGERVRIRLCVDRDARSTPVTGDGVYTLSTVLRNPAGFAAKDPQFAPSVTLVSDACRRYDEGTDPLDRARLHFLAPNGPARPMELSKGFVFPVQNHPVFTGKPEWVMPVGAGELSAMVSFGTNEWHVNLSKTDYYLDKKGAGKDCDICSPGHVQLVFDGLKPSDIRDFDQAMDVKRGRVTLSLKTGSGAVEAEIFGDRKTGALVGIVNDLRRDRTTPPRLTYESNHPDRPGSEMMSPAAGRRRLVETFAREGRSFATEVARFNDGMFVIVSKSGSSRESAIAAVESAIAELKAKTAQELVAARDAWWKDYWSKSFINVTGDARAALIERLWYAQLYVWAGVGFGRVPPKFNGGAGLVLGDGRSWGAGVWTQNTRELCWPLGAANHREFMRRFVEFYESCRPQIEAMHAKLLPAVGGFRMFETIRVSDSGFVCAHTNAASLDVRRPYVPTAAEAVAAWKAARHSKKKRGGNGAAICSSGTEILQQMVDYVRYYGDTSFVPVVAAWLRSQTELYLALLEKGADGRWHPVNTLENESWYCPEDCHVDLCAARFCLGMTAKLGRELGFPAELVAAASERLEGLAPLPTAQAFEMDHANIVSRVTKVTPGDRLYLPFKDPEVGQQKGNLENNELYAVYPFTMGDREKNVATFRQGSDMIIYGWEPVGAGWGWYPVPMWASRLCLPDAADFVYAFAVGNNTWPFGGGRSPAAIMYKGAEVEDSPYLDSAGVLQAATQELFLQSHAEEPDAKLLAGGPIRLIPAVPKAWSGSFKLLARGGFEVTCAFEKGVVKTCSVLSTRGGDLVWEEPGTGVLKTLKTEPGGRYEIGAANGFRYHTRHIPAEHVRPHTRAGRICLYTNRLCAVTQPENLAALKAQGVDTVELRLTWEEIERTQGVFDFSRFDREVRRVEAAGLDVGLMAWFNYAPKWYRGTVFGCAEHECEGGTLSPWDPATLRQIDRLYGEVAKRYGRRIGYIYVTGSGDFGEPVCPQGVAHYRFNALHNHGGIAWTGDPFARAAWAKASPVPLGKILDGEADDATCRAYARFVAETTATYMAEVYRITRRHFPWARFGVPIGHFADFPHGQWRTLVVKKMCAVSPDFTARWSGMGFVKGFANGNVPARRISSAAHFYGCRFGEEAAWFIDRDLAPTALYETIANGSTMLHNDFGNILKADDEVNRMMRTPLYDLPETSVAVLWPDDEEARLAGKEPSDCFAAGAFVSAMRKAAARLRAATDYAICDSLMVRDGFLAACGVKRLVLLDGREPAALAGEIAAFRAKGGEVVSADAYPEPPAKPVYRTVHRGHVTTFDQATGKIDVRPR